MTSTKSQTWEIKIFNVYRRESNTYMTTARKFETALFRILTRYYRDERIQVITSQKILELRFFIKKIRDAGNHANMSVMKVG